MKTINDFLTPEELEMATPSSTNSVSRINSTTSRSDVIRSDVKEELKKELEATRLRAKNKPKADVKPQRKSITATNAKAGPPVRDIWPEITLKEQPKIPDGVLAPRQKRGLL